MPINCIHWLDYNFTVPLCLLLVKLLFYNALYSRFYILYMFISKQNIIKMYISLQSFKLVIAFTMQNKTG